MIPKDLFKKIRRIQITTSRLVTDVFAGQYHSVFKGRGMEFDEVREYQLGDDIRTIDWNVTARTNIPHVKRYAEERELTILFLVDVSRSGIFGSGDRAKLDLATELAAVLMFSALKNNDKVEHYSPPRKGKGNILRLIRELVAVKPRPGGTNVAAALEFARRVSRRKAVIFLLSDLPEGDFEDELRIVNRRHDLVVISVGDRRDSSLSSDGGAPLPGLNFVRLADAETGRVLVRDLRNRAIRQSYEAAAAKRLEHRRNMLRRSRVDELAIDTSRSYVGDLHQFFRMRERRIGQGR